MERENEIERVSERDRNEMVESQRDRAAERVNATER